MITFNTDVPPEKKKEILDRIEQWESVSKAMPLKADSKSAEVRRMAYAYVKDKADAVAIIERLSEIPEIESASLPAKRKLL
jgi:hypothetical protein